MTTDLAAAALRALSDALLSMLEQDTTPPCADGTDRWVHDDHAVRAKVAPRCADCEIHDRCRDFADSARPRITHGIWAGDDYSATTRNTPSTTDPKETTR
jgi:hypothetical protein